MRRHWSSHDDHAGVVVAESDHVSREDLRNLNLDSRTKKRVSDLERTLHIVVLDYQATGHSQPPR
jgi:hypothetical protein